MKVLLKQVFINDPISGFHNSRKDLLITDGIITQITDSITETADQTIDAQQLTVSPGWIDCFAHFNDPGFEFNETLETGAAAAAAGGFVTVMTLPNTAPAIDSKSFVEYIVKKSQHLPVNIIPIGAISKHTEGKELAEMYDMHSSGAEVFSDGLNPVQSAGLLLKALLYIKTFDGVIIQVPEDKSISPQGLINEGIISTRLGLPGKPMMAEELIVARDIKLARYAESRLHFTGVTSPKSIEYISRAKASGLNITCSVTPYHLFFCDEDLMSYDSNLKVNPPLRTRADMMALRQALSNGKIDCIATHHLPHHADDKLVEFEYAKNGMIGLETAYAVLKTIFPDLPEQRWAELLSINPASIFGLDAPSIGEGQPASLTLYNPTEQFIFSTEMIHSKSRNSPLINQELTGRVKGIFNRNQVVLNN